MSLPQQRGQRTLFHGGCWVERLFGPKDRYRVFREKVLPLLWKGRKWLDELYCAQNGRPGIEPVVMAGVTLLEFMEKVPDGKAVEMVRLNLGWKYALDLALDDEGFHSTSLVVFRKRLLEGGKDRLMFDVILEGLRECGLVRRRSKQRLDSTHVLGCVSEMSRLEVVRETIRLVLEEMERRGCGQGLEGWRRLNERYRESEVDWRGQGEEEVRDRFREAGEDALKVMVWLRSHGGRMRESDRVLVLERVFLEQYEYGGGGVGRRESEGSGAVKNPHDPEAQWSTKDRRGKKGWVGYKGQVAETVDEEGKLKKKGEPTEQFLTDVTTTEGIGSDLEGMGRSLKAQRERGQELPPALFVDAAYVTDDTLAEAKAEDRELVGPARPSPEREGVLSSEQFDVDVKGRKAVCPGGKTSTQCSWIRDRHAKQSYYRFEWGSQCDGCPLHRGCTKSKSGRRTLVVGAHHDLLQARRREMETEAFRNRMRQRNGIEGTISELVRLGLRRSRYRGLAKTALANHFLGAACNVNRWIRLTLWQRSPVMAA